MIRFGFTVLVAAAILTRYTPVAMAGCEGGDSSAGHNAIAFCCDQGGGNREKGSGDGGRGESGRWMPGVHVTR